VHPLCLLHTALLQLLLVTQYKCYAYTLVTGKICLYFPVQSVRMASKTAASRTEHIPNDRGRSQIFRQKKSPDFFGKSSALEYRYQTTLGLNCTGSNLSRRRRSWLLVKINNHITLRIPAKCKFLPPSPTRQIPGLFLNSDSSAK